MYINYFTSHVVYITSFLGLSFNEIKNKLRHAPVYLVEYVEKNKHEKFIEAPMSTAQTYMICCFDENNICNTIMLHFREIEDVKKYLLQRISDYDFIKSYWTLENCNMKVQETEGMKDNICLLFYK